jgi:hypothetical protein
VQRNADFHVDFTFVPETIQPEKDRIRVRCSADSSWCPYRNLAVDLESLRFKQPAVRRDHTKMGQGKVMFSIHLAGNFPTVRATCFSCTDDCSMLIGTLTAREKCEIIEMLD